MTIDRSPGDAAVGERELPELVDVIAQRQGRSRLEPRAVPADDLRRLDAGADRADNKGRTGGQVSARSHQQGSQCPLLLHALLTGKLYTGLATYPVNISDSLGIRSRISHDIFRHRIQWSSACLILESHFSARLTPCLSFRSVWYNFMVCVKESSIPIDHKLSLKEKLDAHVCQQCSRTLYIVYICYTL